MAEPNEQPDPRTDPRTDPRDPVEAPAATPPVSPDAARRFVPLFAAHQKRVYGLIRTLVVNPADADDLLQEASVVLWEKFAEFTPGTDFAAWAMAIARNLVLNHWRKQKTRGRAFERGVFDAIVDEVAAWDRRADARTEALRDCLTKLSDRDRDLVRMRYAESHDAEAIARRLDRSIKTVYRMLSRVHGTLLACIRLTLGEGGR